MKTTAKFFFQLPSPIERNVTIFCKKVVDPARSQAPSSTILPVLRVQTHGIGVPLYLHKGHYADNSVFSQFKMLSSSI